MNESTYTYCYPLPYQRTPFLKRILLRRGIPKDELYRLGIFECCTSPESHTGPFSEAIDFLVPDGTPVFAARMGRVVDIEEDSTQWGADPSFAEKVNYITLDHHGELSQYCHLAKGSVSASGLSLGALVSEGQQIGVVGKTGWTDRDHLHFIVFMGLQGGFYDFQSLKPRFEDEREIRCRIEQ